MPRNDVKTSVRGSYSAQQMKEAVHQVMSGEMSVKKAAAAYHVPRSTIMDHVKRRHDSKSISRGKPRALPQAVEEQLVDTIRFMRLRGFHLGYRGLRDSISDYLVEKNIQGFRYGKPTTSWTRVFLAHYNLSKPPKETKEDLLTKHFCLIKDTLDEFDLSNRPDKIWCLREHPFTINKDECVFSHIPEDVNATVVTACNAAGRKAPMLVVLKDNPRISSGSVCHASTETGRLDKDVFATYFTDTFLEKMQAPFLVIYNGNASSIDIKLIEDAREKGVIFLKTPTSFYKDVADALKENWYKDLRGVTGEDQFIDVIKRGYSEFEPARIRFGFKNVGIHPFDSGVACVDFPKAWEDYLKCKAGGFKEDAGGKSGDVSGGESGDISGGESGDISGDESADKSCSEIRCDDMDAAIPEFVIIKDDDEPEPSIKIEEDLTVVMELETSTESLKNTRGEISEVVPTASTAKPVNPKPTPLPPSKSKNDPSILRKTLQDLKGPAPFAGQSYGGIIDAARTVRTPSRVCSVFGCRNNEQDHSDKDFYPFPADQELRKRWLQPINRLDLEDDFKARNSRVCSDHFDQSDYTDGVLKADVVPHLELPRKRVTIVYALDPNSSGFLPATTSEVKTEPINAEVAEAEIQLDPKQVKPSFNVPAPVNQVKAPAITQSNYATRTLAVYPLPMNIQSRVSQPNETGVDSLKIVKVEHTPSPTEVPVSERKTVTPIKKQLSISVEHISIPPTKATVLSSSVHVQTTKALMDHMNLPLKRKYQGELQEVKKKVKRLEYELASPKNKREKFLQYCDEFLDKKLSHLVKSQAYLSNRSPGNRYSADFKSFALSLYQCSPQSYKFVERIFSLPSKNTLNRIQMPVKTGINEKLIESFKVKVGEMSAKEKMCTLCFDYMSTNKNLFYDVTNDHLCGFQEIDQVLGPEPAQYAILLMARGLYSKWAQPISFAFVAKKTRYPAVNDWMLKITSLLFDIGLNVKALVTDMDNAFLDLSDVSATVRHFEVNDRKVYFMFDVPNLFKNARDDFLQYDLHYGSKVAKWSHFSRVYEIDQEEELSLMPKITKDHVNPQGEAKDNVKIAVEVFSHEVAAAMNFHVKTKLVPKTIKNTVHFLTTMSRLYSFLMSQKTSSTSEFEKPFRATPEQKTFLTQCLEYLQMLELRDKNGDPVERSSFVTGLIVTVKSLMSLSQDLKAEKIDYILTRNLSKDCMEGYFAKVRCVGGNDCARPTCIMFARTFRRMFLRHLMSNTKDGETDMDLKDILSKISDYVMTDAFKDTEEQTETTVKMPIGVSDYQTISLAPTTFISGYLLWKCLEKHHCQTLLENFAKHYDLELPASDGHQVLKQKFQVYNSSNLNEPNLIEPPKNLLDFVDKMDRMFQEYYKTADLGAFGFGWNFYKVIEEETFDMLCPCFPLKFLKCLFIRTKIHQTVKAYNKENRPKRRRVIK